MKRLYEVAATFAVAAIFTFPITTFAAESSPPIKIGVLADMNGVYSAASGKGSVIAAKMAIEDFGGSVLGKPIEFEEADSQDDPRVAARIAKQWYTQDGVTAIFDLTDSAVALAVQNIARNLKKIDIVTGATMTTALANKDCSPWGLHWTIDAYNQAAGTARYVTEHGGKSWFFITVDFAFGHDAEAKAAAAVEATGGKVLGNVLHPLNTTDYSSYLLQARASGAQVVGLATAGTDMANIVKQAAEFHMLKKQKFAALVVFLSTIHGLGLNTAQGLVLTTPFYWDLDNQTRTWSEKFYKKAGFMPGMFHAGIYSAVTHYLQAVKATNSSDSTIVMNKMRATPVNDFFAHDAHIRRDGVLVRDMYLAEVKRPSESKGSWDLYKILNTIPSNELFEPTEKNTCKVPS